MKQTAIFPGRYVQQEGAIRELGEEVARLGTNVLLIAGATAAESIIPSYQPSWNELPKGITAGPENLPEPTSPCSKR